MNSDIAPWLLGSATGYLWVVGCVIVGHLAARALLFLVELFKK
ncbi:coat protein [Burkholderia phage vB_BglM_WTB]